MTCPYCTSTDSECEHLLLAVDTTFRETTGGALYELFSKEWHKILEREGANCDEYVAFHNLLNDVDSYADAEMFNDHEGGPGQSSSLSSYYCETKARVEEAVERFGLDRVATFEGQRLAENAIKHAKRWVSKQRGKWSLDDVVQQIRHQPGASKVIDQRPVSVIIKFTDGSGVGVNSKGLDLLQPN